MAGAAEEAAQAARSKDRMQNVGMFFVAYAVFKYISENELL